MVDSDSDDELMSRLTSATFGRISHHEDCAYCGTPNAALMCSSCHAASYCSETCKMRHAKAHRNLCIIERMKREQAEEEEEEESSEEESDSESEDVVHAQIGRTGSMRRRTGSHGVGGFQVPGLTEQQIQKLLALSAKAESMTSSKEIDKLQQQIAQLMSSRESEKTVAVTRDRSMSTGPTAKEKDLRELQKKLQELEKKTQTMSAYSSRSGVSPHMIGMHTKIYTPLLVKDDPAFRKYFKLKDMSMPIDQIKGKMEADGVSPALLDTPDAVSPNDPGPSEGAYIPMTVKDDPAFKKYFKLKTMDMPIDQIKLKMEADGVDPDLLDNPGKVSPNDPGPPLSINVPSFSSGGLVFPTPPSSNGHLNIPMGMFPASSVSPPTPPYIPLLVKDDPKIKKYFKLQQMGMPAEQIKLKMSAEEVDPTLLDRPDDVSPNDPGPPPPAPVSGGSPGSPGSVSMEQLFSILMQHQQIIQQVSSGGGIHSGNGHSNVSMHSDGPPRSVEDQMALELAAAESAIDDIFGDEQQQSKGPAGMSMIEQLEKKARKESNKKLVDNRDEVNRLISELLAANFESDEQGIKYYNEICPKLENFGLSLGVDANQTWSARLLIKNKDTRDWYFTEQQRFDAGKAYIRLWGLSFLDRDAGQLISKRTQILNAPATLRTIVKGKPELIDKFLQLLKDAVKLKHKIFKNNFYAAEIRRLRECNIPERFEERGTELIDASTVLADAAMDLAEEEFRLFANTTRAKKIRAATAVHIAEKAVQLVGIVKKLGANGVNEQRLSQVDIQAKEIRETYLAGQEEEEEEDDVL